MRERKKKQNEARSNKSKTKTILVSALLDSGPSGYEGDLKKYKRWGGGGGVEDGALANPAICRTLFYGKRELFVAGQKQERAIFPTCRTSQITEYMYATH